MALRAQTSRPIADAGKRRGVHRAQPASLVRPHGGAPLAPGRNRAPVRSGVLCRFARALCGARWDVFSSSVVRNLARYFLVAPYLGPYNLHRSLTAHGWRLALATVPLSLG